MLTAAGVPRAEGPLETASIHSRLCACCVLTMAPRSPPSGDRCPVHERASRSWLEQNQCHERSPKKGRDQGAFIRSEVAAVDETLTGQK